MVTIIEVIAVAAICIGFWHEERLARWEGEKIKQLTTKARRKKGESDG